MARNPDVKEDAPDEPNKEELQPWCMFLFTYIFIAVLPCYRGEVVKTTSPIHFSQVAPVTGAVWRVI